MKRKPSSKLFSRYFSANCTEKEKSKIESWIAKDPGNKEIFGRLREIWELSSRPTDNWDPMHQLDKLSARMREFERTNRSRPGKGFRLYRIAPRPTVSRLSPKMVLQYSAGLIAFVGLVYAVFFFKNKAVEKAKLAQNKDFIIQEASTKPGQQVSLQFADGTKVVLNSASRLKYSTNLAGVRNVYLAGEAYFEVVHSKIHPFIVHVADGAIRDVGTKFDVEAWPGDDRTQVTVVEGIVSVHPEDSSGKAVVVRQDQFSVIRKNRVMVPPTNADVLKDIEWMKGKHSFENDPVKDVIKQVWRSYGIHCFVSDTSLLSREITTSFDNHDPAKRVLNIIALSLDLKYKVSQDSVFFIPERPRLKPPKADSGPPSLSSTRVGYREKG